MNISNLILIHENLNVFLF